MVTPLSVRDEDEAKTKAETMLREISSIHLNAVDIPIQFTDQLREDGMLSMPSCLWPCVKLNKLSNEEIDKLTRSDNRVKNMKAYFKKMRTARVVTQDKTRKKRQQEIIENNQKKLKIIQDFLECSSNGIDMYSLRDEIAILKSGSPNFIDRDNMSETSSISVQRPRRSITAPERFSHVSTTTRRPKIIKPETKVHDSNASYEVEAILNMNLINNQAYFLVKWEGYSSKENTWEPLENIKECDALQPFLDHERLGEKDNIEQECNLLLAEQEAELEAFKAKPKILIMNELKQFDPVEFQIYQLIYMLVKKHVNFYQNFRKRFKRMIILNHFHKLDIAQYEAHKRMTREFMGKEKNEFSISIANEVDFSILKTFEYVRENIFPEEVIVQDQTYGCKCEDGCTRESKVCCPKQTKSHFAYKTINGKKRLRLPNIDEMIFECNQNCSCDADCLNRVTQQPRRIPLQIFRTSDDRGWGLRAMAIIPKGSYVIEYTGEVIDQEESVRRGEKYDKIGYSYLFDLDYNDQSDAVYCIDAIMSGNLSRFINHSCEPNCAIYPVTTCGQNSSVIYKLCYFSTRFIAIGEEITFDYNGGKLEENNPTLEEGEEVEGTTHNSVRGYRTKYACKCGTESCRGLIFDFQQSNTSETS